MKRKPHPFGNEYHTIADVETKIIFGVEIVETKKDAPTKDLYAKKCLKMKRLKLLLFVYVLQNQSEVTGGLLD